MVGAISNAGRSKHNDLHTNLTKQIFFEVCFTAGYVYSHGLDRGSLNRQIFLPQKSLNPAAKYASSEFDIRLRFPLTTSSTFQESTASIADAPLDGTMCKVRSDSR